MSRLRWSLLPSVLWLLTGSCQDIAEVDLSCEGSVAVYSSFHRSLVGTIDQIDGGLVMCRAGYDQVMVVTSSGLLHRLGVGNCTLDATTQLPLSPAFGGNILTVPAAENYVYVLCSGGTVLEVRRSDMQVCDAFTVGSCPSSICSSSDGMYLYVTDSADMVVRKIWELTHEIVLEVPLPYPPVDMITAPGTNRTLGLCGDGQGSYAGATFQMNWVPGQGGIGCDTLGTLTDIATMEGGELMHSYVTDITSRCIISMGTYNLRPQEYHPVQGIPTCVCGVPGSGDVWACSYDPAARVSHLYIIDGNIDEIIWHRTIPGYARDIIADVSGQYVLVLMAEENN